MTIDPALNNYDPIAAAYPTEPLGMGTPTDKALEEVVTKLPVTTASTQVGPDASAGPVYVILATDGQPNDLCSGDFGTGFGGTGEVEKHVIDMTTQGTLAGMQMFVISLAGDDMNLQAHLEQVAMATASKTPPFVPATQSELVQTIRDIVGTASCQVDLRGTIESGKECAGNVTLNGTLLDCNSDNGWRLVDADTLTLTGSACESFTSSASSVRAMFPCEVFRPD